MAFEKNFWRTLWWFFRGSVGRNSVQNFGCTSEGTFNKKLRIFRVNVQRNFVRIFQSNFHKKSGIISNSILWETFGHSSVELLEKSPQEFLWLTRVNNPCKKSCNYSWKDWENSEKKIHKKYLRGFFLRIPRRVFGRIYRKNIMKNTWRTF